MVPFYQSRTGNQLEIPMEEYVLGVVAAEMDPSFPEEALAAQAIAVRTYTLRRIQMGEVATDDIRTFQAYGPERITEKIRAAVAATRGKVILHGEELVEAVYHACAGGTTAGAGEGLQIMDQPYLRPVADPPCRRDEEWVARFSVKEVGAAAGLSDSAWQVAIGKKGPSGRALTLRVNGREVSAFAVRARLGGTRLKSTLLTSVHLEGGSVLFRGRGYGHGVGMSQWGAAALAEKGLTPDEIIQHYYAGVAIEQRW